MKKSTLLKFLCTAFVGAVALSATACDGLAKLKDEATKIESVTQDENGDFVVTFADGTTQTVENTEEDKNSIVSVTQDENGDFVVTFADGTTQTVENTNAHKHSFGEWAEYTDEDTACDKKLFFRTCSTCKDIEWEQGTADDHNWNTVTTAPTCTEQGYDTVTCTACGEEKIENYTPIQHTWAEAYAFDNSYHWVGCSLCDEIKDKAEHTLDDAGVCSVCDNPIGASEGLLYDILPDGTAQVVMYEGTAKKVRIAETYQGVAVTKIGNNAFKNSKITSIVIPDSVTSIGEYAFYYCDSLTSITIPDSVTSIGNYAFYYCDSLTSITIPDSVTSIGDDAFYDCDSLTSITIPDSVTSIGNSAFMYCDSLTSVVIGDSVTSIGNSAFRYCYSLTSVEIPDIVTSIGSYAFSYCHSLTSVEIPDSVTSIGNDAFASCSKLQFNEYGNAKYLGSKDNPYFALIEVKSQNFSSYTIHNDTKVIADSAFSDCDSLTSVVIGDSVTSIGNGAFSSCDSLTSVVIGDSVTSIGNGAFSSCDSLTSVYYKGTAEEWKNNISIGSYNDRLTSTTRYYYSESEPALNSAGTAYNGNFWKYGVNGEVVVWKYKSE